MGRVYYVLLNEDGEQILGNNELDVLDKAVNEAKSVAYDEGPVTIVRCEEVIKVSIKVEEVKV